VACIESIDASTKLRDLPFISRAVRAFSLTAAPDTLRTGTGPLLPVHELVAQYDGPLEELTGQPGLPVSGSVSTMAFSLARFLGCSPLVLVGQDLAYTEGKTYATGTGYESSQARFDENGLVHLDWNDEVLRVHGEEQGIARPREPHRRVPAWGGQGEVDSAASFANIQDWFRRSAELLSKAGSTVRLVNCTEGGVHIPGFEDLALAQLLAELPERQPVHASEIAGKARELWTPIDVSRIVRWLEKHADACQRVRRVSRRIRRLAEHASRVTLIGDPRRVTPAYDRLEEAELEVREAVAQCPLVDAWAHKAIHDALYSPVESPEQMPAGPHREAREATQRSARVASAVETAARELEQALREGAARLAANVAQQQ
jgi:hypothetical protein